MIRYTCNKKAFPQFHKDCLVCPEYAPCAKGGKWCFVAEMENENISAAVETPAAMDVAAPVLRDMSTVTVNFGNGMKVDILREDVKKQLTQELYKSFGLMYRA